MKTKLLSLCILLVGQAWGKDCTPAPPGSILAPVLNVNGQNFSCSSKGKWIPYAVPPAPKPGPIDVPAIQEKTKRPPNCVMSAFSEDRHPTGWRDGEYCSEVPPLEWTCREKSRIKLTAEDGKVWCHKPQVQP